MKKKLLLRGALGFPIGIAIGYVITICISVMWAEITRNAPFPATHIRYEGSEKNVFAAKIEGE